MKIACCWLSSFGLWQQHGEGSHIVYRALPIQQAYYQFKGLSCAIRLLASHFGSNDGAHYDSSTVMLSFAGRRCVRSLTSKNMSKAQRTAVVSGAALQQLHGRSAVGH
eukprot:6176238-Pleurochrysis_carterae.AAC.1